MCWNCLEQIIDINYILHFYSISYWFVIVVWLSRKQKSYRLQYAGFKGKVQNLWNRDRNSQLLFTELTEENFLEQFVTFLCFMSGEKMNKIQVPVLRSETFWVPAGDFPCCSATLKLWLTSSGRQITHCNCWNSNSLAWTCKHWSINISTELRNLLARQDFYIFSRWCYVLRRTNSLPLLSSHHLILYRWETEYLCFVISC